MPSLRSDLASTLVRKNVPDFTHGSMRDLASKLGLSNPVSLRSLGASLDALPPASVIFSSGPMTAGYVHGWAELGIQSDGLFSFRGHVHENGIAGDNYFFGVALHDAKDTEGRILVLPQDGWLAGRLAFGPSDRDFQNDGFNQLLTDHWAVIRNAQPDRVQFRLHVSTNAWQLTETLLISLFGVAVLAAGGYAGAHCDWRAVAETDAWGQPRAGFRCEKIR